MWAGVGCVRVCMCVCVCVCVRERERGGGGRTETETERGCEKPTHKHSLINLRFPIMLFPLKFIYKSVRLRAMTTFLLRLLKTCAGIYISTLVIPGLFVCALPRLHCTETPSGDQVSSRHLRGLEGRVMAGEIQGKKLQLAGPWCITKDFPLTVFGPTHT